MDRDQLLAFDQIAREGSFTRAAISLGIGQPAVSARIQALEQQVGGALFTRRRSIALTALGESFLPFARRALEILGEGIEAARLAQTGHRGRVRLAALGSLAGGLVGSALGEFVSAHPAVDCTVRVGDHERVVQLLLDGLVELGIVTWPCTEAEAADLHALHVFREPVVLVARPGHVLARKGEVSEDELVRWGRPLFRLRWWQTHHPMIVRLAERTGSALELAMEAARSLALEGVGVGFFTRTYIAEDLKQGNLVEVTVRDLPRIWRDSALVRRRRAGPLSPSAAALVEAIRKQAAELALMAPGATQRTRRRPHATVRGRRASTQR